MILQLFFCAKPQTSQLTIRTGWKKIENTTTKMFSNKLTWWAPHTQTLLEHAKKREENKTIFAERAPLPAAAAAVLFCIYVCIAVLVAKRISLTFFFFFFYSHSLLFCFIFRFMMSLRKRVRQWHRETSRQRENQNNIEWIVLIIQYLCVCYVSNLYNRLRCDRGMQTHTHYNIYANQLIFLAISLSLSSSLTNYNCQHGPLNYLWKWLNQWLKNNAHFWERHWWSTMVENIKNVIYLNLCAGI